MKNLSDSCRELLYLPLGFIPAIFFTLRMTLQWFQSERKKKSYVSCGFWKLSLFGNITLFFHHLVQVQYPFAIIQGLNAVISWRNINLINSRKPSSTKTVIFIAIFSLIIITILFLLQSYFFYGDIDWIRTPTKPWDNQRQYDSLFLHIFGTMGGVVLSCRFWAQWMIAEFYKYSELNKTFWYLSITGSLMLIIYSFQTKDIVIFFYNCFGLIPYFRNLFLIRESDNKKTMQENG